MTLLRAVKDVSVTNQFDTVSSTPPVHPTKTYYIIEAISNKIIIVSDK